jgi:L-rhamnonate dehydratase
MPMVLIICLATSQMSERADMIDPNYGRIFKSEPLPDRGYIELPTTPGFGFELNRDEVHLIRPCSRSGIQ